MADLVSVLFPCYNAAEHLEEALQSILAQSHAALEVLALDDGSTDRTAEILTAAAAADERVRVIANGENLGLVATLNRGLDEARGPFIARMDADDWSHPRRLERQLELLETRVDVDVVGTVAELMRVDGTVLRRHPARCFEPAGARFLGLFAPPIVHPSLLARAEVVRRHGYSSHPEAQHTEDYDLFARMLSHGVGFANVREPLLRLRVHAGSVSRRFEQTQVDNFITCSAAYLERSTGLTLPSGVHRALVNRIDTRVGSGEIARAVRVLDEVRDRFLDEAPGDEHARVEIVRIADEQRLDILVQALTKGTAAQRLVAAGICTVRLPSLMSGDTRRYLRSKLERSSTGERV